MLNWLRPLKKPNKLLEIKFREIFQKNTDDEDQNFR